MMELNFFRSNVFISDFPTFVNYWQNQRAKTGFPKRCIFLQIYKHGESVTLCSKYQYGFDLQQLSTFLDAWGVLENGGLLLNFLRRRLFQPIEFLLSKFDSLGPTYQTSKGRIR